MIPRTTTEFQPIAWKRELAQAISDPNELLMLLELQDTPLARELDQHPDFRLRVPRGFVSKMKKGDEHDPLLRQVLPISDEHKLIPGYVSDPVADLNAEAVPGVLHKYHGRALLVTTGACGIHCRYCFRRHFPYGESRASKGQWLNAMDYIKKTPSINEVLLSGGDPLSLSDKKLAELLSALEKIPHVKRLRIHTRMPVVLPERVDHSFIEWISHSRLQMVMVIHANHANEIDETLREAMANLSANGVTLLNQSVLLRGVNDDTDSLIMLSEKLFNIGVLPYYLHLLDPVQGAAHFDVSRAEAIALMDKVRNKLPGYLIPKLVWEKPGAGSKLSVA